MTLYGQARSHLTIKVNKAEHISHRYLSLQNRLLKVCYVPATIASLNRLLFLLRPLTVLMKQTRQAVHAVKQSILLRCLWLKWMLYELICIEQSTFFFYIILNNITIIITKYYFFIHYKIYNILFLKLIYQFLFIS